MKRLVALLFAGLLSAFAASSPSLAADPQAGRDFKPINPPLASSKEKIEVVEFFRCV